MKKKNIALLRFEKCKISNLHNLRKIIGGDESYGCVDENPEESIVALCSLIDCNLDISINPLDCATNDGTKSLAPPSVRGQHCNAIGGDSF